ncbi:methylase [bacterium]|nr:methylase [bacterium]
MAKAATNRRKAAKEFADFWKNKGDERQETARFWIGLLEKVLGMENPAERIEFEKKVQLKHTSFIDAYIPETKVLIEQKSVDTDLRKEVKQSDGAMLTPYRQAKRYADEMPNSLRPDWIVVCNFREFLIYDMEKPHDEPVQVLLEDLPDKFECLQFMVDSKKTSISPEEQVSLKAGELVGKLYDALIKEYIPPTRLSRHSERSEESERSFAYAQDDKLSDLQLRSLNILCVRIVFCLYAEDAGLFETRTAFEDYIKSFNLPNVRDGIIKLFKALDTKLENRDKYDLTLNSFPYVNGGLFADSSIEIPNFTKEIVDVIVNYCAPFDWSEISPTIFGAVFESTLNPETRRKGGMHYTSIKNIHKVIDPLFLDDLKAEFAKIVGTRHSELSVESQRDVSHSFNMTAKTKNRLEQFRDKLANLKFLDPACGSGNFLTETYISLRRLENECLKVVHGSQMLLSSEDFSPIKVKISQFYGIEINDFAVTVAKTALWIAESQMMKETEEIVEQNLDFLPLSTSATIVEGNALRMDWLTLENEAKNDCVFADRLNVYKIDEKFGTHSVHEPEVPYNAHYTELNVVTPEITERKFPEKDAKKFVNYDYIIGNPPFVGARFMEKRQKEDLIFTFGRDWHGAGDLDYVCCWYKKAFDLIKGTNTRCAFVSTNSVTQGASVANLWKPLFAEGLHFDFAWRTFKWANETTDKKNMATVHCVIIGFSVAENTKPKIIFENEHEKIEAKNINGYLMDLPELFIENRKKPLCEVPEMVFGSMPNDGQNLIIEADEYDDFVKNDPASQKYIHRFLGADEFINSKIRYCLWLVDATPAELRRMPLVAQRIGAVRKLRESSARAATRKLAETPWLFGEIRQPEKGNYLLVPRVSSENRIYIPIGFTSSEVIASDATLLIPDVTLYEFGIMTSSVHNAWMRAVCGRLESRYRYSASLVYNNFPWCYPTDAQKAKIEQTAQAILDARAKYPDSSLADLYDETFMPPELRKAHKENDKAVMQAYGFNPKMGESEVVAELFKMYEKLTKKKCSDKAE